MKNITNKISTFIDKYLTRKTILLLFLMTTGTMGSWGQTDYSGVYYIGTKGYNAGTPANNYYLCPTEGWAFFVSDGNVQAGDNGKPFLTTYRCKTAAYHSGDPSDAVWTIEKDPGSNYYYIKQTSTGRYMVSNGAICSNPDRARVHLETINDPNDLDEKALFDIYLYSGHLVIRPIGITDNTNPHSGHTNHKWLTVNQGNFNQLDGNNKRTDGPTGFANTGGIICLYTEADANAEFHLEKATIDPPTITNNYTESNTITITTEEGATIYYTTDGTTPTTSAYTGTGTTSVNITVSATSDVQFIKAIAKSPSDAFPTAVKSYSLPILERPVISVVENIVTITAADGASIYYTTDDTEATPSATPYSGTFSMGAATAIRAIATKIGYYRSAEAVSKPPLTVHHSSEMTEMNRSYILADDFISASSIGTSVNPFRGTIDGNLNTISGLDHALVAYADGAIIKNIILDDVNITSGTNVGAICNEATGACRIYNCGILSGSVSGSGKVGSLVGLLDGTSRVINCYSYAEVGGGSDVGGIVGYNAYASTANDLRTMVMNCMFYGDITSGTNVSPVYGGLNINNLHDGLNTYNYYSYENATTFKDRSEDASKKYNCALAVEEKYLNRFEFYRLLLNSNKKLAAIYATGSADNASEMAKWVLETADRTIDTPKPYPILKTQGYYPSIINYDAENAPDSTSVGRNHGGRLGLKTLSVSIISKGSNAPVGASITNGSLTLIRTDKDFDRFNYNYDKVQLPYYDEVGEGNYTEGKVVTGWKITNITTIAGDPYTSGNYDYTKTYSSNQSYFDAPNYNFADRKSSNKDLYSVSKRVFSQGAYFDVPYGVTSITIEPYWGNAAYVADENYDVVYQLTGDKKDYDKQMVSQLGTQVGGGAKFNNQTIYTTISSALGTLSGSTVYDNAVVLVGNLHQSGVPSNGNKAFTLMSVDLDKDHEPDYSLIYHHNNRQAVSPIRFDFLNIPGTAQAQKPNGSSVLLNFTIFLMKNWFEITNTCLAYSNQIEYENDQNNTKKSDAPLILLGGVFDQFVSTRASEVPGKTTYIHVGSNVMIKSFGLGTHSDGNKSTPHVPVSVTGGEYEGFYLTGTYNPDAAERSDNAECYISSGYFKEAAGACQEPINGNVTWQIYNADIDNFYGGGINDTRPIKGTITTNIFNSHVGTFCGGPKFGNMQTDKDVTTNATGCTFDEYFGAGYGGLSYSRQKYYDESGYNFATATNPFNSERGKYYNGTTPANGSHHDYGNKGPGVATDYDYEFFVWSTGVTGARVYVKFASFSLAKCNDVYSTLTGCTINRHFYGGGSLGEVTGKATSILDGCTVHGNVFGGGFSASLPTIEVRDGDYSTKPKFNSNSGIFEPGVFSTTTTFTWKNATEVGVSLTNGGSGSDLANHYVYTDVDLDVLGQVGETDLTIKGNTIVEGKIFDENGDVTEITGGVFGGGDQSAVNGDTKVDIQNTDGDDGVLNVFGGGNTADVDGNSAVTMTGGKVKEDVYGGGKGATTIVNGNVSVTIGAMDGEGSLSGAGTVSRNVYGGSAFGSVNATKGGGGTLTETEGNKTTLINIYGGLVMGSVFGGGLGKEESGTLGDPGYVAPIAAQNFGNTTLMMRGGMVKTAVYGGSNVNGVLKKDATITLLGGIVGTPREGEAAIKDAVFGGGKGQPTLVNGDITVNVGTLTTGPTYTGTAAIHGNVYGGSALGNTNASKTGSDPIVYDDTKETNVNLYAGTITGNVFGGGLGQKNGENGATSDIEAFVGGDVNVTLDGAKLGIIKNGTIPLTGQIFGCNNLNGSPKGHVKVWVKRTVDSDKSDETAFESRTTYDVAAVYGGGNKANYNPTKATGSAADKEEAFAEVIIEGCDATSIEYVYGGGNAAAVPATDVTVKGTYIIDYLFGGGNGAGAGNPGADVGIMDKAAYAADPTTGTYGTGKAVTRLIGGKIRTVFGGSNTKGNVRGGTKMTMPQKPNDGTSPEYCSVLEVKNIYGAGNEAEQDGAVDLVLGCVTGMENVYGGAKNANVAGGINLTITSGHFSKVFGGNNESGTIQGPITLNIEETACDPITIDELYIGGYLAPYSVYGYYEDAEDGNKLKPRTSLTDHTADAIDAPASPYSASQWYANPELNVISCTSIGNVFGGGYGSGAVLYGSPTVNMNMVPGDHAAEIDRNGDSVAEGNAHALGTIGNIYGGGSAADVYGDATINIGTAETVTLNSRDDDLDTDDVNEHTPSVEGIHIIGNVYGGGLSASIHGNTQVNIGTKTYETTGYEGVSITGNVFGGGQGETTKVTGNVAVTIGEKISGETPTYNGNATITGDIYGGSALGSVNADGSPLTATVDATTSVTLNIGTVTGSVYGGGLGQRASAGPPAVEAIEADVYGEVTVTINNGTVSESVYGCNNLNGSPQDDVNVVIAGGTITGNVYGGGNQAAYTGEDELSVTMSGGTVTDVFGGGLGTTADVTGSTTVAISGGIVTHDVYGGGSEADVVGTTSVTLTNGTISNDIYGGGKLAAVTDAVTVALNGGSVTRDVYGGGALANTNTVEISTGVYPATSVTLNGATVTGIIYGGGLGRKAVAAEGTPGDPEYVPAVEEVAANVYGPVTVTITSGRASNVFGCNNLNGAPLQAVVVNVNGGTITNSVFGGGNQAAFGGSTTINMTGGTINYNVFGGGNQADVAGSVAVNISGGEVKNDVYGGGALANTNTGNWDEVNSRWRDTSTGTYYAEVKHLAVGTSVSDYWIRTGGTGTLGDPYTYTEAAGTAISGTKYYKKLEGFLNVAANGTTYSTSVILTGGIIGNAYGGGLGQLTAGGLPTGEGAVKAMVYGDVSVTVNGAAFTKEVEASAKNAPVTGRVFGCNNVNGTPKGKVTVTINATRRIDNGEHTLGDFEIQGVYGGGNLADYEPQTYDADTEFGQYTKVIINDCEASISKVYGGGNAARVPFTDVIINGAFEIGYVFGGGNGGDMIYKNGNWVDNTGANVTGHTNVLLKGGTIGQAFGGSDSKGTVGGSDIRQETGGFCPLRLVNMYGAGNGEEASSDGDIYVDVSGCGENNEIQNVYGGSYKANITGNVTLNIKSGIFTSVFGGNDRRGSIGGNITVNIEETDNCDKPIIIQNLYGGCYQTAYPGESNQDTHTPAKDKEGNDFIRGKITVNVKSATRIDRIFGGSERGEVTGDTEVNINMVRGSMSGHSNVTLPSYYTESNHPSNITVNPAMGWISAYAYIPTTPAEIAEGRERSSVEGYYTRDVYTPATGTAVAEVTYYQESDGDYTVAEGISVGDDVTSYYTKSEGAYTLVSGQAKKGFSYYKQVVQGTIAAKIGTIGDVFGGGNIGRVDGSTVVNIGTATTVTMETVSDNLATEDVNEHTPQVLGAHITGDVYGGCNNAVVTGDTEVNICTADYSTPPVGFEDINIENGSVYGGGCEGDVLGNTFVTMSGGYVFNGIFGGGYSGSVGTFTRSTAVADVDIFGHTSHAGTCLGKPISCAENTGLCTVVVNGGQIGPVTVATDGMPVPQGWVWGGGCGLLEDPSVHHDTHFKTYVDSTDVTIGGTAFIMEGVIGGGEFGRVLRGTHVTIEGSCQIGVGAGKTETVNGVLKPKRYDEEDFIDPTVTPITADNALDECMHWPFEEDHMPYDPYSDEFPTIYPTASTSNPTDGTTWIGVVFGGGSGYMPYLKEDGTGYEWMRSAGYVEGNTLLEIKGGHILSNVYGANEYTDVEGKSTVIMTDGTIGVPRTKEQIAQAPTLCCLFGAGKGDQRTHFNTWTNVQEADVKITGGIIYGSVFGGGEEGHVLGNVTMTIGNNDGTGPSIGCWGTSNSDGNVFGGGRGYAGRALTAGSIGGNVTLNIKGGKMLGSVYGGGRMASVGTYFANVDDTRYGNFKEDDAEGTYGHVTVNISGGTIGNDDELITKPHTTGGNIYGGSMGRLENMDRTPNTLWAQLAQVKTATVNITGNSTLIKGNVYGGGEFGTVRDHAYVTVGGTLRANKVTVDPSGTPTLIRDVYGGGYGYGDIIHDAEYTASVSTTYMGNEHIYTYTPMKFAGCVGKSTLVNIAGGWVKKNVYGGGEMASVGIINYETEPAGGVIADDELKAKPDGSTKYKYITKHHSVANNFALSWPYEVSYISGYAGTSTVNVTGGRIGITGKDIMAGSGETKIDNGDIFGGCKGAVGDRYDMAFCGNVNTTTVNINYTSSSAEPDNYKSGVTYSTKNAYDCIAGSVYGGGENGHVIGNSSVTLTNGLIGHAIYGGGKGKDTYKKTLNLAGGGTSASPADVYSITAGKVYGNTNVTMEGGYVVRTIYGGGNLASVGKGNYAGGADDFTIGYGEKVTGDLWANTNFTGSGKTTVVITAGQVGYIDSDPSKSVKDNLPYGNVFGGCRGQAAAEAEGIDINPDFYVGYVNETDVTIGDASHSPRIYGSVYGGGQDGHVRRDTKVTINDGEIGAAFVNNATADALVGTHDITDLQWIHRGNVYGGGSGIGKYEFDGNGDGSTWTDANSNTTYDEGEEESFTTSYGSVKEIGYSSSAGSVTRNTTVEIKGGTIHRNVYGGGSLASVIPPGVAMSPAPYTDASHGKMGINTVNISGGNISSSTDYGFDYGGNVFGAGRGMNHADINPNYFSLTAGTQVNILPHPTNRTYDTEIAGNVYGGGEMGVVKQNTEVNLTGGYIKHDVYGGGKGLKTNVGGVAADVGGNTTVLLNQGVATNVKGCIVNRIFGCNDMYGTPKGHPLVHVFATQNANTIDISHKIAPPTYASTQGKTEGYKEYLTKLTGNTVGVGATQTGGLAADATVITAAQTLLTSLSEKTEEQLTDGEKTAITNAAKNIINELEAMHQYDVEAVYGGGDMADYIPTDALSGDAVQKAKARTEVIIEGCNVTSIYQVYGGGNAASTPATDVKVESVFIIDELFGGGNGKDNYTLEDDKWYENPGANVGYTNFMHYVKDGTQGTGVDEENMFKAILNTSPDARTPEDRQANYAYGQGEAKTTVTGGHVHKVYGGSNEKGNICKTALSQYQKSGTCTLLTDETYGGSKNAEIDAEIEVVLDCVESTGDFFGGSTNANINSNVTINITNGTYGRIFGGNNKAGTINGNITINIEERGCTPIIIGELYGGGYLAPYSIYGFQKDGEGRYVTVADEDEQGNAIQSYIPLKKGETGALDEAHKHRDPFINIISATSIGNIYGGGYKAKMIASPHINVNMTTGRILEAYKDMDPSYASLSSDADGNKILPIGTIGNIYGGGNQADIIGDTHVEIGTGTHHNVDNGVEEAIEPVRNAAKITGIVYGGGKLGHVGDFTLSSGKPISCTEGTGTCYVTISNGTIGPDGMQMTAVGGPDDSGHVFGGGQGTSDLYFDDTTGMTDEQKQTAIAGLNESALTTKITTVNNLTYVNNTEVVVNGETFVKGSVYGGGFDGHVLGDTHVTIDGNCQIGCGRETNDRHPAAVWADDYVPSDLTNLECASWPYGIDTDDNGVADTFAPHDKFANVAGYDAEGGAVSASNGHTFYGNVFAGGSGYYPYAPGHWLHKAGWVEGNTLLEIKGGHILTNVYGGNEMTNVGDGLTADKGKCTIRMAGGTIGVPRTLTQINAHPVTCYLFGAGKGDQIVSFNTETNVKEVEIEITGGRIYGSVFGGGEDGHVLGDIKMAIDDNDDPDDDGTPEPYYRPTKIGTWGTSYVDGNVFGGGRGYSGNALTAGNVGGSIDLNIKGGTMLGNIYGGGRLGSVGYGLYAPESPNYGVMRDDNKDDAGTSTNYYTTTGMNKLGRGHIEINISGGTIGNNLEYIIPNATNIEAAGIAQTDFKLWSFEDWATWKNYHNISKTEFDTSNGRVTHTKGGNVYAGGMGRILALDDSTPLSRWKDLGNVKSTKLTISGDTWIMGNVYGGGEFGAVTGYHTTKNTQDEDINTGTEIIINGGTIGTEVTGSTPVKATIDTPVYNKAGDTPSAVQYTFGSVYGGGYGSEAYIEEITTHTLVDTLGAYVADSTYINMTTGHVRASVYGGGEIAGVGGSSNINISGGEIGRNEVYGKSSGNPGYVRFGNSSMGNVFGGGKGTHSHTLVGIVKGNSNINISAGAGVPEGEPFIYHNVYGGGSMGSIGTFDFSDGKTTFMQFIPKGIPLNWTTNTGTATINVKGGTIGISGRDNGMVNGSARGDIAKPIPTVQWSAPSHEILKDPYDKMAWVKNSIVNIGESGKAGPHIKGSVYGGGENGHVFTHTTVNIESGIIGIVDSGDPWYNFEDKEINEKAAVTRGNVYGSGCGTDTYTGDDGKEHHNVWAGCVIANTEVNISGGHVAQNVYGGGSMGSVGRLTNDPTAADQQNLDETNGFAFSWPAKLVFENLSDGLSVGKTTVNITGGRIGTTGSDNGDVFGGTRGEAGPRYSIAPFGNVRETEVIVNYPSTPADANLAIVENLEDGSNEFSLRVKEGVNAITGSVYGGCEDGHVYENTKVDIRNGLIGHSVYGGGKGMGTYIPDGGSEETLSIIAGKVYGNTKITMSGGYVMQNIYGGGNLGSVGKGNYASGTDDYYPDGYGEKIDGNLWDKVSDNSKAFMNSGIDTINITGGIIGFMANNETTVIPLEGGATTFGSTIATADAGTKQKLLKIFSKDDLPTGNVFGGCRGQAAMEVMDINTNPAFFLGYVNETDVTIGNGSTGPRIYGSVYGGGQDGHVRRGTKVTIKNGEIGIPYDAEEGTPVYATIFGTNLDDPQWLHRGNVYGGGSGIGKYKTTNAEGDTIEVNSSSAGSVIHTTTVSINNGINGTVGNTIHRNVYGGGSVASVCPPVVSTGLYPDNTGGLGRKFINTVTISGTIGTPNDYVTGFKFNKKYGGEVYGASRGDSSLNSEWFANSVWTKVLIKNGANILGNVFGGGDAGTVKKDSEVIVGEE